MGAHGSHPSVVKGGIARRHLSDEDQIAVGERGRFVLRAPELPVTAQRHGVRTILPAKLESYE
jgi:hypothetical protein